MHLAPREEEITNLVSVGLSNKIIAYRLGLKESTVKNYLFHLFKKVGVNNRTGLAMWEKDRRDKLRDKLESDDSNDSKV